MQDLASISSNLLNFQSSIEAELTAELFIGKQLNLERARYFALTNNITGLMDEINGQISNSVLSKGDAFFLPKGSKEKMSVKQSDSVVYLRGSGEVPANWKP